MDFLDTKAMLALLERIATALEAIAPKQPEPEQATTDEEEKSAQKRKERRESEAAS